MRLEIIQQQPSKRYLNANQLRQRYGNVSHMWIERRLADDPTFPRFQKFGRLRFWDEKDLERWERSAAKLKADTADQKRLKLIT